MYGILARRLLAGIAILGTIVVDVAFLARLWGTITFDAAMSTAIIAGVIATLAGGFYLLVKLADITKHRLSI